MKYVSKFKFIALINTAVMLALWAVCYILIRAGYGYWAVAMCTLTGLMTFFTYDVSRKAYEIEKAIIQLEIEAINKELAQ